MPHAARRDRRTTTLLGVLRGMLVVLGSGVSAAGQLVETVAPAGGTVGTTITVRGEGFGEHKGHLWLAAPGSTKKLRLRTASSAWSDAAVTAELRHYRRVFAPGRYDLVVEPRGGDPIVAPGAFTIREPRIGGLSRGVIEPGGVVFITGDFGPHQGRVRVAGKRAHVFRWKADSIGIRVPASVRDGVAEVLVRNAVGQATRNAAVRTPVRDEPIVETEPDVDDEPAEEAEPQVDDEPAADVAWPCDDLVRIDEILQVTDLDGDGADELLVLTVERTPAAPSAVHLALQPVDEPVSRWTRLVSPDARNVTAVDAVVGNDADGDGHRDVRWNWTPQGAADVVELLSGADGGALPVDVPRSVVPSRSSIHDDAQRPVPARSPASGEVRVDLGGDGQDEVLPRLHGWHGDGGTCARVGAVAR